MTVAEADNRQIQIDYVNWKGERRWRVIEPIYIWFGSTEWHPDKQWLLKATDIELRAERDFAITGIQGARTMMSNDQQNDPILDDDATPSPVLLPHQQRVVQERNDLDEKIEKLAKFLSAPAPSVTTLDLRLLQMQLHAMRCYSSILRERILHFQTPGA